MHHSRSHDSVELFLVVRSGTRSRGDLWWDLHRYIGERSICTTCNYNSDDCLFPTPADGRPTVYRASVWRHNTSCIRYTIPLYPLGIPYHVLCSRGSLSDWTTVCIYPYTHRQTQKRMNHHSSEYNNLPPTSRRSNIHPPPLPFALVVMDPVKAQRLSESSFAISQ